MEQAMIYGRHVDFESLRKDNMDVEPEIVAAGWRKFFQIRETVYQNEVYDFWKNMSLVDNTIVSTVDRLTIIVTMESIEKVTECPSAGEKLTSKARWMMQSKLKEIDINQQLYGNNDPKERKASSLVPKARVLHSILFHCILPRTGSRHLVTTLDEQCLFHLLNRQPVDLPHLIFHYMEKTKKEMNSHPYGMLLTRIFRDSGVRLDSGIRRKLNVKSAINSATIGKMGLKNLDREEADSETVARTEGERPRKRTPIRRSTSQPGEKIPRIEEKKSSDEAEKDKMISRREGSQVRYFEKGSLKRKGETLLAEVPKQAKRSPRVRTLRQQEEKKTKKVNHEEESEKRTPQTTRSLVSILREDTAKLARETEIKRKLEFEKKKPQPKQQTPRLIEEGKRKISQTKGTPTTGQKKRAVTRSPAQVNTSQPLRKEDLRIKVIEEIQPVRSSAYVIIKATSKRLVKAQIQPILVNSCTLHLLNEDEKSMYAFLRDEASKPYPTQMTKQKYTIFPFTKKTVFKVVPDLQPPPVRNYDKGKAKMYPERLAGDLTEEEIEEEVRNIEAACSAAKTKGIYVSRYFSMATGSKSGRPASDADLPVGGRITRGTQRFIRIGENSYDIEDVVHLIMQIRPLCAATSIGEVVHLLGKLVPRLPCPDDLDLLTNLSVRPPTLIITELEDVSSDAYTTTVSLDEPQQKPDDASTDKAEDLSASVRNLYKEVEYIFQDIKLLRTEQKEMFFEVLAHLKSINFLINNKLGRKKK